MNAHLSAVIYYLGRILQALAMWILLMDVFVLAGPMGPPPNPFYVGVAMFIVVVFAAMPVGGSGVPLAIPPPLIRPPPTSVPTTAPTTTP